MSTPPHGPRVLISAGFAKTHMTTAAAEAYRRGTLAALLTGAYPTARLSALSRRAGISRRGRAARLSDRGEALPDSAVRAFAAPELLCELGLTLGRLSGRAVGEPVCAFSFRAYGRRAARVAARAAGDAAVYHYRAGFGQSSLGSARAAGLRLLCDQAIAHPAVLESLIASRGRTMTASRTPASPVERAILADIEAADAVLVNSDFVRESFLACGWPAERVHVVYLGVDENFMRAIPPRGPRVSAGPVRLLYAGRLEERKGADVLVEALASLDELDWELVVAGPVTPEVQTRHQAFLRDSRVHLLGAISRSQLALEMVRAPVFVFPSFAEGSARVVFEALACGCFVITTPNAGTIVQDGVHGALIAPGDARALASAVGAAAAGLERVAEIGEANAALIRERFRQRDYGDGLATVYATVAGGATLTEGTPVAGGATLTGGGR